MTQPNPPLKTGNIESSTPATNRNLALRILSAAILAPLAVATAYLGGWPFAAFWLLASAAILWEWFVLTGARTSPLLFPVAAAGLAVAAVVAGLQRPIAAILTVLLGALAVAVFAPAEKRGWAMAGMGYAAVILLAPIVLRADPTLGFAAIVFLFAIVWTTDVLGYFVGRSLGGPKLAPAISPGKTWSGAIGGTIGAMAVVFFAMAFNVGDRTALVAVAFCLSVAAQMGDLLESSLKRRFNAKDTGHLIPGHGGVMDRLDGFWAAILLAAVIGLVRGGIDAPTRGLLVW